MMWFFPIFIILDVGINFFAFLRCAVTGTLRVGTYCFQPCMPCHLSRNHFVKLRITSCFGASTTSDFLPSKCSSQKAIFAFT